MIVGAYAFRHSSFNDPTLSADLGAVWAYVANPLVFGLVSVARGLAAALERRRHRRLARLLARRRDPHGPDRQLPQRDRSRTTCCPPPPTSRRSSTATSTSRWPPRSRPSSPGSSPSSAPGSGACCATSTDGSCGGRAPRRATPARTTTRSPASPSGADGAATGALLGRRLDRDVGQHLVEPARHVPRLLAEHGEQRRHDGQAHDQRVGQDRDREQQAELLADAVGRQHEGDEHRGHDDRRGEDHSADRPDAIPDRVLRGLAVDVLLPDPAHQEDLVVHREPEEDRERDRWHEALDRPRTVESDQARGRGPS